MSFRIGANLLLLRTHYLKQEITYFSKNKKMFKLMFLLMYRRLQSLHQTGNFNNSDNLFYKFVDELKLPKN